VFVPGKLGELRRLPSLGGGYLSAWRMEPL
jgi:hypothetical protein